jgi:hypothetical protein
VPAGAVGLVYGDPAAISSYLIPHPVIRKISFTGSTVVGKQLAALAGQHMKRVTMELGGHAPVIVFDDADVQVAAKAMASSKFRNAGQVCISPTRFLVQEGVYDSFVEHFAASAKALKVGNGLDKDSRMGALANPRRAKAMEANLEDASRHGAKVVAGGHAIGSKGNFWEPTVVTELPNDAKANERGAVRTARDHQSVQELRRRGEGSEPAAVRTRRVRVDQVGEDRERDRQRGGDRNDLDQPLSASASRRRRSAASRIRATAPKAAARRSSRT